jgi:hypothetical protein
MADTTIVATEDTFLDEGAPTLERDGADHLNYSPSGASEFNPIFQFDVSSLSLQTWDTVKLNLTFHSSESSFDQQSSNLFLSYITKTVVMSEANWTTVSVTPAVSWDTAGAETSSDNDFSTRVPWTIPSGAYAIGDMIQSPNLSDIVKKAINENSGILFLLMYGGGSGSGFPIQFRSTDHAAEITHPNLLFSGVGTPIDTSANPVLQSAAGVTTVSDRPPVSEPDRNVTIAIRHDGPEPMTILAIIKRINYGEDA